MSRPGPKSNVARAARLAAIVLLALSGVGAIASDSSAQTPQGRGLRTIILVRHGVYDESDARDPEVGRALLSEGREQARLTGKRLAAWPARVDALYASTMTRARETAEIIAKSLPGRPPVTDRNLRECEPPGGRAPEQGGPTPAEADSCAARLEADFARYFRPSPERDSTEVLVCHGNVIRWLTCRALGADPKLWLGMSLANCSLTVIQVRPNGTFKITAVGDRGHLPVALQTWAMPRAGATRTR